MAAGDRQRTWFPEMVDVLRTEWRHDMSWDELIGLRDRLDDTLQGIRRDRNIQRVVLSELCPCCQGPLVQGSPAVSVRATILALARFRIAPEDDVKQLDKRWNKHRRLTCLDLYGKQP